jgi:hypothetical protein
MISRRMYQQYRRRLDGRLLLEHYGAQNCSEQAGPDGTTEIIHSCLLDRVEPHHSNGDQNPSACLNVDKKVYVCYSLGWGGDLFRLIQKLEDAPSLADVTPMVGSMLTGSTQDSDAVVAEINSYFTQHAHTDAPLPTYSDRILTPWMVSHPYLREERGISQGAHEMLRLGYDADVNRVVFPHFVHGDLVGWQTRAIPARDGWPGTDPDWPKYKSSSGFPKAETLYAMDLAQRHRPVVVVESPMSVAKAYSLGITNVVATFGAKVTDTQLQLLRDYPGVTVWFDGDPAGRSGERKLVDGLHTHTVVSVVVPEAERDLGDYNDADEVTKAIAGAVPATMMRAEYARAERYGRS